MRGTSIGGISWKTNFKGERWNEWPTLRIITDRGLKTVQWCHWQNEKAKMRVASIGTH